MRQIRVVVFGKSALTDRQRNMLLKYLESQFGKVDVRIEYMLGLVDKDELARIYPAELCPMVSDAVCVDFAVFEYDINWIMLELLKKGIRVVGFVTAKAILGDGDIYDGKVKTVGIVEYELTLRKKQMVVY